MINAEYEELNEADGELDLADTDSLPWLESDEDDESAGGLDPGQIMLFAAALVLLLGAVVGGVWYLSNRSAGGEVVADGGVIEAPAGPIKERPDSPGGKEFAGTGNLAPVVGEGGKLDAVVADKPVAPTPAATKPVPVAKPSSGASPAPAAVTGIGVQLAAYGTRARAEQGWSDISRRTDKLAGVKYRVVEGKVDIGTVYRLQAVAPTRAEAEKLCAALKADGLDCQIK
jgi:SPOR domain